MKKVILLMLSEAISRLSVCHSLNCGAVAYRKSFSIRALLLKPFLIKQFETKNIFYDFSSCLFLRKRFSFSLCRRKNALKFDSRKILLSFVIFKKVQFFSATNSLSISYRHRSCVSKFVERRMKKKDKYRDRSLIKLTAFRKTA